MLPRSIEVLQSQSKIKNFFCILKRSDKLSDTKCLLFVTWNSLNKQTKEKKVFLLANNDHYKQTIKTSSNSFNYLKCLNFKLKLLGCNGAVENDKKQQKFVEFLTKLGREQRC